MEVVLGESQDDHSHEERASEAIMIHKRREVWQDFSD